MNYNIFKYTILSIFLSVVLSSCGEKQNEEVENLNEEEVSSSKKVSNNKKSVASIEVDNTPKSKVRKVLNHIYMGDPSENEYIISERFMGKLLTLEQLRKFSNSKEFTYEPINLDIDNKGFLNIHFDVEILANGGKIIIPDCHLSFEPDSDELSTIRGDFFPLQTQLSTVELIMSSRNTSVAPLYRNEASVDFKLNTNPFIEASLDKVRGYFSKGSEVFDSRITKVLEVKSLKGQTEVIFEGVFCHYNDSDDVATIASKEHIKSIFDNVGRVSSLEVTNENLGYSEAPLRSPSQLRSSRYMKFSSKLVALESGLYFNSIYPDSQAYHMGLQSGDKIVKMDDQVLDFKVKPVNDWLDNVQVAKTFKIQRGEEFFEVSCEPKDGVTQITKRVEELEQEYQRLTHSPYDVLNRLLLGINEKNLDPLIYFSREFQKEKYHLNRFSKNSQVDIQNYYTNLKDVNLSGPLMGQYYTTSNLIQHMENQKIVKNDLRWGFLSSSNLVFASNIKGVEARLIGSKLITGTRINHDGKKLISTIELKYTAPNFSMKHGDRNIFKVIFEIQIERPQAMDYFAITSSRKVLDKITLFPPQKKSKDLPDEAIVKQIIAKEINTHLVRLREGRFNIAHRLNLIGTPRGLTTKKNIISVTPHLLLLDGTVKSVEANDFYQAAGIQDDWLVNCYTSDYVQEGRLPKLPAFSNTPSATEVYKAQINFNGVFDIPVSLEAYNENFETVKRYCHKYDVRVPSKYQGNNTFYINLIKEVRITNLQVQNKGGRIECSFIPEYEYNLDDETVEKLRTLSEFSGFTNDDSLLKSIVNTTVKGKVKCELKLNKLNTLSAVNFQVLDHTPPVIQAEELDQLIIEFKKQIEIEYENLAVSTGNIDLAKDVNASINLGLSIEQLIEGSHLGSVANIQTFIGIARFPARNKLIQVFRADGKPAGKVMIGGGDLIKEKGDNMSFEEFVYFYSIQKAAYENRRLVVAIAKQTRENDTISSTIDVSWKSNINKKLKNEKPIDQGKPVNLKSFITQFYESGSSTTKLDKQKVFFADKVEYFGSLKTRIQIKQDQQSYHAKWKNRSFNLYSDKTKIEELRKGLEWKVITEFTISLHSDNESLKGTRKGIIYINKLSGQLFITKISSETVGLDVRTALSGKPIDNQVKLTQPNGGAGYIKDIKGTLIWNNKPMPNESAHWTGRVDGDGFATGKGTLSWFKSKQFILSYEGLMVRGKLEGQTVSKDRSGEQTIRTWKNGVKVK